MKSIRIEMRKDEFEYSINNKKIRCDIKDDTIDYSKVNELNNEFDRNLSTILSKNFVTYIIAAVLVCLTFIINWVTFDKYNKVLSFPQFLLVLCAIILFAWLLSFGRFTRVEYVWDSYIHSLLEKRNGAFSYLLSCSRIKLFAGQTVENCPKKNAGSRHRIDLQSTKMILSKAPKYLKIANDLKIIQIKSKGQQVLFLPDRILIVKKRIVFSEFYKNVSVHLESSRYIENTGVPSDAQVVDYTWQYVNVDGSPDRRYNNNYRIPICNYANVTFSGKRGKLFCIVVSSYKKAYDFVSQWNSVESIF